MLKMGWSVYVGGEHEVGVGVWGWRRGEQKKKCEAIYDKSIVNFYIGIGFYKKWGMDNLVDRFISELFYNWWGGVTLR